MTMLGKTVDIIIVLADLLSLQYVITGTRAMCGGISICLHRYKAVKCNMDQLQVTVFYFVTDYSLIITH